MNDFEPKVCRARVAELPPSLREVLVHLANGLPTKAIAERCEISEATVKVYRERLYSRLHVNNPAAATRVAVAAGVV